MCAAGARPSWAIYTQAFDFAIFSISPDVPVSDFSYLHIIFSFTFILDFHVVSVYIFYVLLFH